VRRASTSSAPARTIDIAPTVGSLFSLRTPPGGYDGSVRSEAFVA